MTSSVKPDHTTSNLTNTIPVAGAVPKVFSAPIDTLNNEVLITKKPETDGNDFLQGSNDDDAINGAGGDDQIIGMEGSDKLNGNTGNDMIYGDDKYPLYDASSSAKNASDHIDGGDGSDYLIGGEGNDLIEGGNGNDWIHGDILDDNSFDNQHYEATKGNDILIGGAGHDRIIGGSGDDLIVGGSGDDIISADAEHPFYADFEISYDDLSSYGDNSYPYSGNAPDFGNYRDLYYQGDIDPYYPIPEDMNLTIAYGDDIVYAGVGNDIVTGGAGNDKLYGEEGNDVLDAGDGEDLLSGGKGDNQLYGGKGFDTYMLTLTKQDEYNYDGYQPYNHQTIVDSDNSGSLIVNGEDWTGKTWRLIDDQQMRWEDNSGNEMYYEDYNNTYFIQGSAFVGEITIETNTRQTSDLLGMILEPAPDAPQIVEAMPNIIIDKAEPFSIQLPDGLFSDTDELFYDVITSDGKPLPDWVYFDFDSKILSGIAPQTDDFNLQLQVVAFDTTGNQNSQTFTISNHQESLIFGTEEDDNLIGTSEDDTIYGSGGRDYIYGAEGSDTISYANATDAVDVSLALKKAFGNSIDSDYLDDIENVIGSKFDDYVSGDENDNVLDGGSGADRLDGMFGDDTIVGGSGDDHIYGGEDNDTISAGLGNDTVYGDGYEDWSMPIEFQGDDTIDGGMGDDYLIGGSGDDFIEGGEGNDWLHGGIVNENKSYEYYNPTFNNIEKNDDTLLGGSGHDRIVGGRGNDLIFGGSGNDLISADFEHPYYGDFEWSYREMIDHPTDDDNIYYPDSFNELGDAFEQDEQDYYLLDKPDVEVINSDDIIYAGLGNDIVDGGPGNDKLYGDEGNDILAGGVGDDLLDGGAGKNILYGGKGFDTYQIQINYSENYDYNAYHFNEHTIIDSDNSGKLVVNGEDWSNKVWTSSGRYDGNGVQTWYDESGNQIDHLKDVGIYTITGNDFNGSIVIESKLSPENNILGMSFEKFNSAPIVTGTINNQIVTADETFSLTLPDGLFTDDDGDDLIYAVTLSDGSPLPNWLSFDPTSNVLIGNAPQGENVTVKVTATDLYGAEAEQAFSIVSNTRPELNDSLALDDTVVTADEAFSLTLPDGLFTDDDGDDLTYAVTLSDGSPLPNWLSFDPTSNVLIGNAPQGENVTVKVTATDSYGAKAEQAFSIVSNARPEVTQKLNSIYYISDDSDNWQYALPANTFKDSDNDVLTYSLTMSNGGDVPHGIKIDPNTGDITVDATQLSASSYDVYLTATDSYGASTNSKTQFYISSEVVETEAGLHFASLGDDIIVGSEFESHTLYGLLGNDYLQGGNFADKITGGGGNDTLVGGKGNDYLNGGRGDDTYQFKQDDGSDIIKDSSGKDTLDISDFTLSDLVVSLEGRDLLIKFNGQDSTNSDSITIENWNPWFGGDSHHIDTIQLANVTLTDDTLVALIG